MIPLSKRKKNLSVENLIFANLIQNEQYTRTVLPYLKDEYFSSNSERVYFNLVKDYFEKYNALPSVQSMVIELDQLSITEDEYKSVGEILDSTKNYGEEDNDWCLEQTEKWCQDKAIYNAIMDSIQILDKKTDQDKGAIPELLQDALAVSFDTSIGHDLLEDYDERYDFYHKKVERLPFDLKYFNDTTKGGIPRKTLNCLLASTGVGKSLMMCHFAASNLMEGKNVLYVTLEMAEERIAERIDANLLNVPLNELEVLPKDAYEKKVERIRSKTQGKLIVKEYPTASVGSAHFRHLLNELKAKKKFVPDVIYVDYLNLCVSSRMRMGGSINSYTYVKAIAEELRGLAVEFNLPIFTATQSNRDGASNSDMDLTNTSESWGLPATVDWMVAVISSEELEELGQLMIKQLKNRYSDLANNRRFVIGVDRSKMRLYDVEQHAQEHNSQPKQDVPVMDNSEFGAGLKREKKYDFDDWK